MEKIIRTINFATAILTLFPSVLLFNAEIHQLKESFKNRKLLPLSIVLLMVFATFILVGASGVIDYILWIIDHPVNHTIIFGERLFEDVAILVTVWSFYIVYWRIIKKGGGRK